MNGDSIAAAPKLFISYSWSSPDHEAWVLTFAGELVSQGVRVILDKWDLQPGHDANAFMESMVTDAEVTKVILICDERYVQKSNHRSGGAGIEAQILTPELYAKKDQDKFVAVVRERDRNGRPCVPAYYAGRIYIDLSDPAIYPAEFERLLRWLWDKPLFVRPELGKRPSFLVEENAKIKIASAVPFRRAFDAIRSNHINAVAATVEYFDTIVASMEEFRISTNGKLFDDLIVEKISEFTPYRNELIELLIAIARYQITPEMIEAVHRFFERLLPLLNRPETITSYNESDFDNFRFIIHELFVYCVGCFIKFEKFDAANYLIENEYYHLQHNGSDPMRSYIAFREHMKSLVYRNERLNLRRLSVRADLLVERNKGTGIDFKYLMTADFVLYLRSLGRDKWRMWWPETLLYTERFGGPFEIFARAKSQRYFQRIKALLGVDDKAQLGHALDKIENEPNRIPRWDYESIEPRQLIGFDTIATVP
jgi:hypothetical protein